MSLANGAVGSLPSIACFLGQEPGIGFPALVSYPATWMHLGYDFSTFYSVRLIMSSRAVKEFEVMPMITRRY